MQTARIIIYAQRDSLSRVTLRRPIIARVRRDDDDPTPPAAGALPVPQALEGLAA